MGLKYNDLVKVAVNYMKVSKKMAFTSEDIRYLKHIQLAVLTGIDASNFSAWSSYRRISERNLERIAEKLGMSKSELLEGLELRRKDVQMRRKARAKADRLIDLMEEESEGSQGEKSDTTNNETEEVVAVGSPDSFINRWAIA